MNTYTAKMKHSADTIERLVVMQYNTFQTRSKFLRVFLAMASDEKRHAKRLSAP